MRILIIVFIILCAVALPSFAYFNSIGITPLKTELSARPLSLGGAFIAIPDIDSQFYNPACLPWAKGISISIKDFTNIAASQAYPTGNEMTLGLAFSLYKFSNLTTSSGGSAETIGNMMLLSYSTKLSALPFFPQEEDLYRKIGIGATLKFLLGAGISQPGQIDKNGTGYDLDAGIYYKASPWLSFSAMGGNILPFKTFGGGVIFWKGLEGEESIPAYFKIGTAAKLIGDLHSPIFLEGQEFILSADLENNSQRGSSIHIGGEYTFSNTFSLRIGVASSSEVSFGAGYKAQGWGLNFSSSHDPISNTGLFVANIMYFPEEWHFLTHPFESFVPEDGYTTYRPTAEVSGKVKPGIILNINKKPATIRPDYKFSSIVDLDVGENIITAETYYENDRLTRTLIINRKPLPQNPFAYLNIYDGFTTDDPILEVTGRLLDDASTLYINGKPVNLSSDKSFKIDLPVNTGENHMLSTVLFEDQPVNNDFLIYRRLPAQPIIVKTKVIKPKKTKPVYKRRIKKRYKRIDKSLLKSFQQIQALIKLKTNLTVLSEAEIKLSGYFAVYVLSKHEYIALRDLKNGMISIDFYESVRNRWKSLATALYGELLLFKTSPNGDYIDVFLD